MKPCKPHFSKYKAIFKACYMRVKRLIIQLLCCWTKQKRLGSSLGMVRFCCLRNASWANSLNQKEHIAPGIPLSTVFNYKFFAHYNLSSKSLFLYGLPQFGDFENPQPFNLCENFIFVMRIQYHTTTESAELLKKIILTVQYTFIFENI